MADISIRFVVLLVVDAHEVQINPMSLACRPAFSRGCRVWYSARPIMVRFSVFIINKLN